MSCYKYSVIFLTFVSVLIFGAPSVLATRTVTSVTLNGSSSVTVAPSTSITAVVNVTTTTSGGANWQSTTWTVNGATTCEDHANHNAAGSYSETFTITAPSSTGSYNVNFIAYSNNICTQSASSTYTLTNGIIVAAPTNTPIPPTPTNTPVPPPTPTNTPIPPTPTHTPTPTRTPTPTNTATPVPTTTTAPGQPTSTPAPTATPTSTPIASPEPTAEAGPTSSSTSSTTYYPSVTLNAYSPDPTNKSALTFSGTATIESGTVESVEYSITNGAEWLGASLSNGSFTFTTPSLSEGTHTIKVRSKSAAGVTTQSGSYGSDTVTIITTLPKVTLDPIGTGPTINTTPTLTGSATSSTLSTLTKVEVSIDGGQTFLPARLTGSRFTITLEKLEDGNYSIFARAVDSVGNIGVSTPQTIIIDLMPPIIGGGMLYVGQQIVHELVAGAVADIAISMKGGVTAAVVKSDNKIFNLENLANSNIWVGKIKFNEAGEKKLLVEAVDGSNSRTQRDYGTINVKESGLTAKNATVTLFFFEKMSQRWIVLETQKANSNGQYGFMAYPGKYYLEAQAPGFNIAQSEIVELFETSIINYPLPLQSRPIYLPEWLSPPDSIKINKIEKNTENLSSPKINSTKKIITFIAPWSTPSQEQASLLENHPSMTAVFLQETDSSTKAFMKRGDYTFLFESDTSGRMGETFGANFLPFHVFIDANGSVISAHSGVLNNQELLKKLQDMP